MQVVSAKNWIVPFVWGLVILLALIGSAAAIRRMLVLTHLIKSVSSLQATYFDSSFSRHKVLTMVHIIPGLLFMVLGPLQFVPVLRKKHIAFHRWSGRIFILASYIIGSTALVISFLTPIGGANETAATVFFALIFLFALTKSFLHILNREVIRHREWMIRAFAIGLGVATVRPIVGLFFAFSRLSPGEFFGIAFWLGFTIHLIAAEVWINYSRSKTVSRA